MTSLESIASRLNTTFAGRETEHNWERVDTLLRELLVVLPKTPIDDAILSVKRCKEVIQDTLATERTRLAISSLNAIAGMVETLGPQYEALQEFFLYPMLKLCERTNKVISDKARTVLLATFRQCPAPVRAITNRLLECHTSPNKQLRQAVLEGLGVLIASLQRELLADHLDAVLRIIKAGLQDAADTVRAQSRAVFVQIAEHFPEESSQLLSTLPASVAKSIGSGATHSSTTRTLPNFRTFLATHRAAPPNAVGSEGPKSSGPQRVVQKPATFHPYSTGLDSGIKRFPRAESSVRLAAPRATRSHLPSAVSASASSIMPSVAADKTTKPSRIPTSASTGNLLLLSSTKTSDPPLPHHHGAGPSGVASAALTATPRMFSGSGGALGAVYPPPPTPRAIIAEFRANVTHPEWNHRQKALLDFAVALDSADVCEYLARSQSKVGAVFEVFEKGIKDAHHQVVAASLELGQKLLAIFPSHQHPNALRFATSCIFKLFSVSTNIQFKARTLMIEHCRLLVNHIKGWLPSEPSFLHCLIGALQIHEAMDKARLPILMKVAEECRLIERPSSELTQRNCSLGCGESGADFYGHSFDGLCEETLWPVHGQGRGDSERHGRVHCRHQSDSPRQRAGPHHAA